MSRLLLRLALIFAAWSVLGAQLVLAQTSLATSTLQAPSITTVVSAEVTSFALSSDSVINPDAIWQSVPQSSTEQPTTKDGEWFVSADHRTAAKFKLNGYEHSIYTLEVPLVRMDLVQLFWRSPGGIWKTAQAGDTVALSSWPVVGQFPTFVLHFEPQQTQLELIVVMQNAGNAWVAVMLLL